MATAMTADGVAPSTPQPPPHAWEGAEVAAASTPASSGADASHVNTESLVELLTLPLQAAAAAEPPRVKRKYTKRAKPTSAAVELPRAKRTCTKRKKPTEAPAEAPRVKRKYTKRKKLTDVTGDGAATDAAAEVPRVKRKYTKRKKPTETTTDDEAAPAKRTRKKKKKAEVVDTAAPEDDDVPVVKKKRRKPDEPRMPSVVTRVMRRELGMTQAELDEASPEKIEAIMERHMRKLDREQRFERWLTGKPSLPPHMKRDHRPLPEVVVPDDPKILEKVEKVMYYEHDQRCGCGSCHWKLRERKVAYQYACRVFGCKQKFNDVVDFLEHQIDAHSTLTVYCKRVGEEVARHQNEALLPPLTVYVSAQYLRPGYRPTPWTMERLEEERETLDARIAKSAHLLRKFAGQSRNTIAPAFMHAYERVKQFGMSELDEQYKIALEHYESSLVFPVGPRNRQDVFSTIGIGRNWLISPEPENAERSQLLKLLGAKVEEEKRAKAMLTTSVGSDDDDTDDEVVLFEFGEMPAEPVQTSEKEDEVVIAQPGDKQEEGDEEEEKSTDTAIPIEKEVLAAPPSSLVEEMLGDESEPDVIMI